MTGAGDFTHGGGPRRPPGRRRAVAGFAAPAGVLAGVVAAFTVVGTLDPNEPGHYPTCPWLYLTGTDCPGCGGLRAAHAVAHGDLGAAVGLNVLAVAAFAVFAVCWTLWAARVLRRHRRPGEAPTARAWTGLSLRPVHWWAVGMLVLGFTVVRNLPFGAALAS